MATIFTKIINGEIPCYKIAENADFIAFLDVNPNAKAHTLVVPKKEVNKVFDLDDKMYLDLFLFAKKIAVALEIPYALLHHSIKTERVEPNGHGSTGIYRTKHAKQDRNCRCPLCRR